MFDRPTLLRLLPRRSDRPAAISLRGEDKKKYSVHSVRAHASEYCWFRWFRVPGGCSSTRSAAVSIRGDLLCDSHASVAIQYAQLEIYDEAVYVAWSSLPERKMMKKGGEAS